MSLFDKFENNKFKSPEERREQNNQYIKNMGIACLETLPLIESSAEIRIKDLNKICKRSIACLLSIQLACDIEQGNDYNKSKTIFLELLKKFEVENELLPNERRLFDNNYTEQDAINVSWTYECYWSLVWALGLIDDDEIKIPSNVCNCEKAVALLRDCKNFDEFKNKTRIRNVEEILDMVDLYYRYHWSCEEKRINPSTNIGNLNSDVVLERRRGLEWLISDVDDWNEISLST